MEKVTEMIRCPECGQVQHAEIGNTLPFPTYIHECEEEECGYLIMESEWEVVK